jgi:hypothetical protein
MKTLTIYKSKGVWMFDDEVEDITEEPFVGGFSELIDFVLKEYNVFNGSHRGIDINFSLEKEDEGMIQIQKIEDLQDDWAMYEYKEMQGMLCPVTLKYFGKHPDNFYIKPKKIPFELEFYVQ